MSKEQPGRVQMLKRVSPADVVRVVERKRGEAWADFSERHADGGRELVLYLARQRSGLTLGEIGAALGIKKYKTVGRAVQRFTVALPRDRVKRQMVKECRDEMSLVDSADPDGRRTKHGTSQGRRMVYVFFNGERLTDLISSKDHGVTSGPGGSIELRLPCPPWRFAALVEPAKGF